MEDSSRDLNKKGGGRFSGIGGKLKAVTTCAGCMASAIDVQATEQAMSEALANANDSSSEYESSSSDDEPPPNIQGHCTESASPICKSLQNMGLAPRTKSPPPNQQALQQGCSTPTNTQPSIIEGTLTLRPIKTMGTHPATNMELHSPVSISTEHRQHTADYEVQPNPTQMWSHFEKVTDSRNRPIPSLQSIIDKNDASTFSFDTPSLHLGPHLSGPNPRAHLSDWADDTNPFPALDPAGVTPEPHAPKLNLVILQLAGAATSTSTHIDPDELGIPDSSPSHPPDLPEDVETMGAIDAAQGSNVVDPLRPSSPPVEEYKETIVNKGKFTPSGAIADELAYLLTAIHDGGWEHTVIEDSSIIEGYIPKNVTNFTLKQLMDRLFFPSRLPYIKKKNKGKAKEIIPSSQPSKNQDIEMISTEGVKTAPKVKPAPTKPTPKCTPLKLPIKAAFPPLSKLPTPKVSNPPHSGTNPSSFSVPPSQPVKSYAVASRSNALTPSTNATKQVVDLVELVKLYGNKLPANHIAAIHQAAVGGTNSGNTNNTSIPQKKKFVIKLTTWGPTHKQILIPYSETVTINCLQHHHHILKTINRGLINQHSKLCVLTMSKECSGAAFGLAFSTNLIPTPGKHDIIHEWLSKAIQYDKDKVPIPRVPMSKSYLKITGVNFYTPTDWHDDGSNQLTADDVLYIMNRNLLFENITLTSPPHVMRATPHSDMAIIWFDIWDSQNGTNAKLLTNCKHVIEAPIHPDWIYLTPCLSSFTKPRVMAYVHKCLSYLQPSLINSYTDLDRDILILFLSYNQHVHYLMNIYSNDKHLALDHLQQCVNLLPPMFYIGGDFNIQSKEWDASCDTHSKHATHLMDIMTDLGLDRSIPIFDLPTRYSADPSKNNTTIDLMFIANKTNVDGHYILPEYRLQSDHAPLAITIPISPKFIPIQSKGLKQGSDEESSFINKLAVGLLIADLVSALWEKHATTSFISMHSKPWWNDKCREALQ
ncbi:hypothetical protein AN958_04063 [Leucoagaricus sp. SymC.cos]|nr:hypothetical protein AN958_04063 [Leucoagaricus sp. SymC.cos]